MSFRIQPFGDVKDVFIRVTDRDARKTICKYKVRELDNVHHLNAMIVGKLYKSLDGSWRFMAIGDDYERYCIW